MRANQSSINGDDAVARAFIDWHRPDRRSPWCAIVAHDEEIEAFDELLDFFA
jgi:hypothetical protein